MKKVIYTILGLVLFLPMLTLIVHVGDNIYAMSLKSELKTVKHPPDSVVVKKDWSVSNCGAASNQCCFAYVEFRKTNRTLNEIQNWYSPLIDTQEFLDNKIYQLFSMKDDWSTSVFHAYFETEEDDSLFENSSDNGLVYGIAYTEMGYAAGLDYRCH